MSDVALHWFLPMKHDPRHLGIGTSPQRQADLPYMTDVARAVERNGFESILLATGRSALETWLLAASLIQSTHALKFLVAMRPGYTLPALTAQMASTFQALSGNRLYLNLVSGSFDDEQRAYGDFLDKNARYARTAEFMDLLLRCWQGAPLNFQGEYYQLQDDHWGEALPCRPKLFFGGSSPAAQQVAARFADVQLMYGEPPPLAAEHIKRVQALADEQGRRLEFGIRIQVIARETSAEAWQAARRLLQDLTQADIDRHQQQLKRRQSVGQARVQTLHAGRLDEQALHIYPGMWAGTGLVWGGGGSTAMVGSYQEVAELIEEYQQIGIKHFILSGLPVLESAYEFAEGVAPLLKKRAHP